MGRYFAATAYASHLYVQGILDPRSWDGQFLVLFEEAQVDAIFNPRVGDREVRTPEELDATVGASRLRHPAIKVWIAEGLEEAAMLKWARTFEGRRSDTALPTSTKTQSNAT